MSKRIVQWFLDNIEKTPTHQRFVVLKQIENIMSKRVSEFALRDLPLIVNPRVDKILDSSFNNKYGGIHVLIAPLGSGKTTYMRSYSNRFINNGGRAKYFAGELQSKNQFFTAFGDENRSMDLFEMLPNKSVIIIDQIDYEEKLNDDMKSLFKHLAYESRRMEGVSVIISTSNINLAKEILNLNGNDKFRMNGTVQDWRWTPDIIDDCVLKTPVFQSWSAEEQENLKKLAYKASCPAFLHTCADLYNDSRKVDLDILAKSADYYARVWEDFENTDFSDY